MPNPYGRPPSPQATTAIEFAIPVALKAKLDLMLYSPATGRIPYGAYKEFFCGLLVQYFNEMETKEHK